MGRTVKNKLLICFTTLICAILACAFIPTLYKAKADTSVPTEQNVFEIDYGASVKANGDGLRFRVIMDEVYYNYVTANDDVDLYAYIAPVEYIASSNGKLENITVKVGGVLNESLIYLENGNYVANVCITDLYENSKADKVLYGMEFSMIAFIKDSTSILYVADLAQDENGNRNLENATRSQYQVINSALTVPNKDYTSLLSTYTWFGSEEYPLTINTLEAYNAVASKDATLFANVNVVVDSSVDTDLADKKLDESLTVKTAYTVKFYNGAELVKEEKVVGGNSATAPVVEKFGYTLSWDKAFNAIDGDLVVNAVWSVRDDTPYTVNHYLFKTQNVDDGAYVYKTETLKGTTEQLTNAQAITLDNYTVKAFEQAVIGEGTVVNIYYTRNSMLVEGFDGIKANGWGTPETSRKLKDDNGNEFNVMASNVSGLKYSVVEENGNKVLKLEHVNKTENTGTWLGLVLTAEQYDAIQAGGSLSFDIKSSVSGTYIENKTSRNISIDSEWKTITLSKAECNKVFPTANATYNQYVYFMYNFPVDTTICIDNIVVTNETTYVVNHYLYRTTTASDGTVLYKEETLKGVVGESTNAQAITLNNYTAKAFEQAVIGEGTVVDIYYTRNSMIVEDFDSINANGSGTPVTGKKLTDDNGKDFNIYVSNVSGLKYSVVEENGNKVLKLEHVNKTSNTGTWLGLVLTAEQYNAIQAGGSLSFDIKSSVSGTYIENKTSRNISIDSEWKTITLSKAECNKVFPTANATYNQYVYFMYNFPVDTTICIDNIVVTNETTYVVNHYLYRTTTASDGTVLYKEETLKGVVGESTNAQAITLNNYTAKAFEQAVIGEGTVVDIYYTRNSMLVEDFDSINASGWGTPVTAKKLTDDNGKDFNIRISNVSGLKYSVVEENDNKVLKLENVNKGGTVGTWLGLVLTAEQYDAIQAGGSLSFDIKSSVSGTYTENGTTRKVSIGTEWKTITLSKAECNQVFPSPNATYNQYIYSMYNLPADSTIYIDNIVVTPNA